LHSTAKLRQREPWELRKLRICFWLRSEIIKEKPPSLRLNQSKKSSLRLISQLRNWLLMLNSRSSMRLTSHLLRMWKVVLKDWLELAQLMRLTLLLLNSLSDHLRSQNQAPLSEDVLDVVAEAEVLAVTASKD